MRLGSLQTFVVLLLCLAAGIIHLRYSPYRQSIDDLVGSWIEADAVLLAAATQRNAGESDAGSTTVGNDGQVQDGVVGDDGTVPPVPSDGETDPAPAPTPDFDPFSLGDMIALADTKRLYDDNMAIFVDARSFQEYAEGHIPGALAVPYSVIASGQPQQITDGVLAPDESMLVVIYCKGGDCDESLLTRQKLEEQGFVNLHVFVEGFPAWKDAGFPVDVGPDPWLGGAGQ